MAIKEIFPNPTVQEVIFQIRFPSLFYIEKLIGDFQKEILQTFPESALLFRKNLFFGEVPSSTNINEAIDKNEGNTKIWQFKSGGKYEMNVTINSIGITSKTHKTYSNEGGEGDKFRDIIEKSIAKFFSFITPPLIDRIGLRYINHCPIPENEADFEKYYNTTFPLGRFKLVEMKSPSFLALIDKKDNYFLRFEETIHTNGKLVLDYDAYTTNLLPEKYLETTDKLHDIIREEYEKSIKQPIIDLMKKPK